RQPRRQEGFLVKQHIALSREVAPDQVHEVLGQHVLADGFRLVYDTRASRGSWVIDARSGEKYLDLYTFFASAPLGSNPRGLADTEPGKTDRFPKFDWPRIDVPVVRFPLADHRDEVERAEARALAQARAAFERYPHDIACFIAEPIQGEGGDNHMRPEFLQAMQAMCREGDALFVLDEVQTGVGLTGTAWAYQQLGLEPDIVAFAKEVQLGGIMAGRRVDEVVDNVFAVSGRINSTWGGGLADMVRSRR